MIFKLLKINMKALLYGAFRNSGKKKTSSNGKAVGFILLFLFLAGTFMMMFGIMFQQMCRTFYAIGQGWPGEEKRRETFFSHTL